MKIMKSIYKTLVAILMISLLSLDLVGQTNNYWQGDHILSVRRSAWNEAANWSGGTPADGQNLILDPSQCVYGIWPSTKTGASDVVIEGTTLTLSNGSECVIPDGVCVKVGSVINNNTYNPHEELVVKRGGSLYYTSTSGVEGTLEYPYTQGVWHGVSSPLSDGESVIFLDNYLKWWDEGSYSYKYIEPVDVDLIPGWGYFAWSTGTGTETAYYQGDFNAGSDTATIYQNSSNTEPGWNMVGNPYPCYIDWNKTGWDKDDVLPYICFWRQDATYPSGMWYYYHPEGPVSIPGDVTEDLALIPPSTSFWVRAADGVTTGSLGFTNSVKTDQVSGPSVWAGSEEGDLRARFDVSGTQAVLRWVDDNSAIMGFDEEYDIWYSPTNYSDIFFQDGSDNLILDTRDTLGEGLLQYNLCFHPKSNGTYTLTAPELNLPEDSYIIVWDNKLNNPPFNLVFWTASTSGSYQFTASTTDDIHRFSVVVNFAGSESTTPVEAATEGNDPSFNVVHPYSAPDPRKQIED